MGEKIFIADKETLDEINGKIGNTSDSGGTESSGSEMSKLNKILSESNKIGDTNDSGGSSSAGTVMAKLNSLMTASSPIRKIGFYNFSFRNSYETTVSISGFTNAKKMIVIVTPAFYGRYDRQAGGGTSIFSNLTIASISNTSITLRQSNIDVDFSGTIQVIEFN